MAPPAGQPVIAPSPPAQPNWALASFLNLPAALAHKIYPWQVHDLIDSTSIIIDLLVWGFVLILLLRWF